MFAALLRRAPETMQGMAEALLPSVEAAWATYPEFGYWRDAWNPDDDKYASYRDQYEAAKSIRAALDTHGLLRAPWFEDLVLTNLEEWCDDPSIIWNWGCYTRPDPLPPASCQIATMFPLTDGDSVMLRQCPTWHPRSGETKAQARERIVRDVEAELDRIEREDRVARVATPVETYDAAAEYLVNRVAIADLAEKVGVSDSQIEKDIDALCLDLGIEAPSLPRGGARRGPEYDRRTAAMRWEEQRLRL